MRSFVGFLKNSSGAFISPGRPWDPAICGGAARIVTSEAIASLKGLKRLKRPEGRDLTPMFQTEKRVVKG